MGQGSINSEAAANMLALFLQIPLAKAEALVVQAPKEETPPAPSVPTAAEAPPPEEEGMEEVVEELKKSADLLRMTMSSARVADAILEEVGCSH